MATWKKVYANQLAYKAEIVKGLLEEKGLSPILLNKQDSSYGIHSFGNYEVHVIDEEVLEAKHLIENQIQIDGE